MGPQCHTRVGLGGQRAREIDIFFLPNELIDMAGPGQLDLRVKRQNSGAEARITPNWGMDKHWNGS
jgi:hypothetical protein